MSSAPILGTLAPEDLSIFHDSKGRPVAPPVLAALAADTHVHLEDLADPAAAIAQCALTGVGFLCNVTDPTERADSTYHDIGDWFCAADDLLADFGSDVMLPRYRLAAGVHPHNAKDYTASAEKRLIALACDPRTSVIGEIGLDYHYDFSPRDVQRDVFARQLELANEMGLPVALHLREAHDDALAILNREGVPRAGAVVHCFALGADVLEPFLRLGCHIAYGGPLTFAQSDDVREAVHSAPLDRIVTETDSPYMAPVPLRGVPCAPAMVLFTLGRLITVLQDSSDVDASRIERKLYANALSFFDRGATPWQHDMVAQHVLSSRACGCVTPAQSKKLNREIEQREAARQAAQELEHAERERMKAERRAAQQRHIATKATAAVKRESAWVDNAADGEEQHHEF
jgi:TatD DNase family protein